MTKVFISYVRENRQAVERLASDLQDFGLDVRTDFAIPAGTRWKSYLRSEIQGGDYFVACFSKEYTEKKKSYMNEELTIAIEQLRMRQSNDIWLIPVRLTDCDIPDRDIGAGETLSSLQWVDLFMDWDRGVERIAQAVGTSRRSAREEKYPGNLYRYAERLKALGLTTEKLRQCVDISKYRWNVRFGVEDIESVVFRPATSQELTAVPRNEFYEDWTYEIHYLEIVSFINRGGMILVDVVPKNLKEHPYDACLSIVSKEDGTRIDDAMREASGVKIDAALPTIRQALERFVEVVAVVIFRWDFNGEVPQSSVTLEVLDVSALRSVSDAHTAAR